MLGFLVYALGASLHGGVAPRLIGGVLIAAGLFGLFEANRGWCVLRALGFKTRV